MTKLEERAIAVIKDLMKSYECYTAQNKEQTYWDDYDHWMSPKWLAAVKFIEEIENAEQA
jgi:hypothetical protein